MASAAAANVDVANAVAAQDSAKDAAAFQQTAAVAAKAVKDAAAKAVRGAAAKGVRAMAAKVVAARGVAVKVAVAKVARTKGVAVKVAPARGALVKGVAVKGAAARAVVARDAKGVDVADVALDVWATWAVEWAKRNRWACLEWVCTSDSRHMWRQQPGTYGKVGPGYSGVRSAGCLQSNELALPRCGIFIWHITLHNNRKIPGEMTHARTCSSPVCRKPNKARFGLGFLNGLTIC